MTTPENIELIHRHLNDIEESVEKIRRLLVAGGTTHNHPAPCQLCYTNETEWEQKSATETIVRETKASESMINTNHIHDDQKSTEFNEITGAEVGKSDNEAHAFSLFPFREASIIESDETMSKRQQQIAGPSEDDQNHSKLTAIVTSQPDVFGKSNQKNHSQSQRGIACRSETLEVKHSAHRDIKRPSASISDWEGPSKSQRNFIPIGIKMETRTTPTTEGSLTSRKTNEEKVKKVISERNEKTDAIKSSAVCKSELKRLPVKVKMTKSTMGDRYERDVVELQEIAPHLMQLESAIKQTTEVTSGGKVKLNVVVESAEKPALEDEKVKWRWNETFELKKKADRSWKICPFVPHVLVYVWFGDSCLLHSVIPKIVKGNVGGVDNNHNEWLIWPLATGLLQFKTEFQWFFAISWYGAT